MLASRRGRVGHQPAESSPLIPSRRTSAIAQLRAGDAGRRVLRLRTLPTSLTCAHARLPEPDRLACRYNIASTYAASTSIVRGDSLGREWARRTIFGTAAIALVWATYFLVGGVIMPASGG